MILKLKNYAISLKDIVAIKSVYSGLTETKTIHITYPTTGITIIASSEESSEIFNTIVTAWEEYVNNSSIPRRQIEPLD